MSKDNFCKSQLITCNRVKECNGVCPFEDALKHADQTADEQNEIDHDKEWIIGCIMHDGFIHTHRFDKANQIILDALEPSGDLISRASAMEAICLVRCMDATKGCPAHWCPWVDAVNAIPSAEAVHGWIPFSCVLPEGGKEILVSNGQDVWMDAFCNDGCYLEMMDDIDEDMAWMPIPKPHKGGGSE